MVNTALLKLGMHATNFKNIHPHFANCPFAQVESFLVAKVSIGDRGGCGDIERVVT